MPPKCPTIDEIRHFLALSTDGSSYESDLLEHFVNCPACLAALDQIADATDTEAPSNQTTDAVENSSSPHLPDLILNGLKNALPSFVGVQIGSYQIIRKIATGGMGDVYEAMDWRLNRRVAIKTIGQGRLNSQTLERLRREAKILAALKHPKIVNILEFGEWRGLPFLAMEFVEGETLSTKMRNTALSPRQAAELMASVARAFNYSHDQGVLHRDLKPSNILIESNPADTSSPSSPSKTRAGGDTAWCPKVIDFGLSKWLEAESQLSHSGSFLGTPAYMAPEQTDPKIKNVGPAADIYAMGVLLYEMLAGQVPFKSDSLEVTIRSIRAVEPISPRSLNPAAPRDLTVICLKCLRKEPARRYQSALELAEDLERFLNGQPILARPVSLPERAWRWARRNRPLAASVLISILLLMGLVSGSVWFGFQQADLRLKAETEKQKAGQARAQAEQERDKIATLYTKQSEMLFWITHLLSRKEVTELKSPQVDEVRQRAFNYFQGVKEQSFEDELTRNYPEFQIETLYHLGALHEAQGDRKRMADTFEQLFERAAKLKSPNAKCVLQQITAANSLAIYYANAGDPEKAESRWRATWDQWKKIDPSLLREDPRMLSSLLMVEGNLNAFLLQTGQQEKSGQLNFELDELKKRVANP